MGLPISPRQAATLLLLGGLAAVPVLSPGADGVFIVKFFVRVMIFAIAVLSLDLLLGYSGFVSFGHAAYLGIGGYSVAILSFYGISEGWLHFGTAVLASAVLALLTGLVALRTSGVYFIMITLGLSQMLYYVGVSMAQFGGDDGLPSGRSLFSETFTLVDTTTLYYVTFAVLVVALVFIARLVHSRFGAVLRGIRINERRTRALGFPTFAYKLCVFVVAGAICGVAGALYVNLQGYMTPGYMNWIQSGDMMIMLLIGGQRTLGGSIVGACIFQAFVTLAPEWIDSVVPGQGRNWEVIFGPVLVLLVLNFKAGLMNAIPLRWRKRPWQTQS